MSKSNTDPFKLDKICPRCGWGTIIEKKGQFGRFYGCTSWPDCAYTESELQHKSDWNDGWDDFYDPDDRYDEFKGYF